MSSRRSCESSKLAWSNKAIASLVITTSSLTFAAKVLSTLAFKLSCKSGFHCNVANLGQVCLRAGKLEIFPSCCPRKLVLNFFIDFGDNNFATVG